MLKYANIIKFVFMSDTQNASCEITLRKQQILPFYAVSITEFLKK